MSEPLTSQERLALIQRVNALLLPDFEELVFAINVPRHLIPPNFAAQGNRSPALLAWVEGPTGCGLQEFLALLEQIEQSISDILNESPASPISNLKPGAPFLAPPLPRHYVPRPEHMEAVKVQLLDETQRGTLVISAIYGMGGIGKSVLAAALVQESDVQERFADGILWVTLGQQPDLLSMVNQWIRELGDYEYNPTTLDAASLHLRTLLVDKRALLVVDDVWHPEHIKPFQIGGAGCCVLVTTRQTKIVGATRYDLDLMTPQQSLDLLTQYLPRELGETEQSQAEAFAQEVGYLPLALELAAAQIEDGVTWSELTEALQVEIAVLDLNSDVDTIGDEAIRKQRSLLASFKLTLKLLSPQQLEQFAWLGIVPEDVSLTQPMAATLWQVNTFHASKILREFRNRALLLSQAQRPGEKLIYRIHDLVHDLAKNLLTHEQSLGDLPGLGLTVEQAHRKFLEYYQGQTQDGLWYTVPDDGYIHRHLAWHFEQAQHPELLHQLLKESTPEGRNGWYEACERLGQTANFVTDVARAWEAAEMHYTQNMIESIALQYRYALITTTLNSLAQNIPPELIAVFVQKGFWQPAQGLAYVRQIQQPAQRAEGLTGLLPYLPKTLMSEALAVARSIPSEYDRAIALSSLAPSLPNVASEAFDLARDIEYEPNRVKALRSLAPHLPEAQRREALAEARSIEPHDWWIRSLVSLAFYLPKVTSKALNVARSSHWVKALVGLIPYLPNGLMSGALFVTHRFESDLLKSIALSWLAPYLPKALLREALAEVRSMSDESQCDVLIALAPYFPEVVPEALNLARSIEDELSRVRALCRLSPYLPEVFSEVLDITCSIDSKSRQAKALSALSPYLPEELMSEVLKLARSIGDEPNQCMALRKLSPYLPEMVSEALDIAYSIDSKSRRVDALSVLSPYLTENLMSELLELAPFVQDESIQARALIRLSPYLSGTLMSEALNITRSLQNETYRVEVLKGLFPYLPEELLSEALEVTRSIHDMYTRAKALGRLSQDLPEIAGEAMDLAQSIYAEYSQITTPDPLDPWSSDNFFRATALSQLAQYLPDDLISKALSIARSIQDKVDRVSAMVQFAPHVPGVAREALDLACSIQSESERVTALKNLVQYLPREMVSEVLDAACSIQSKSERVRVLNGLARYLPREMVGEALNMARSIQNESNRASAVTDLAPYVPQEHMGEALALARSIQPGSFQAHALSSLLPRLKTLETEPALWLEMLHTLAYRDRKSFLADIPKLAPAMLSFSEGDKTVLQRVVKATREICKQWP